MILGMNKRYWLRGGIISMVILTILSVVTILIEFVDIFEVIAFPAYIALLGLGMRGTPAGIGEIVVTMIIAIAVTLALYFAIGALLGFLYGKFRARKNIVIIGTVLLATVGFFIYHISTPAQYGKYSINDCSNPFLQLKKYFDINQCYATIAQIDKDISVCDLLPDTRGNTGKDYCYFIVGSELRDYAICEQIPQDEFKGYRDQCISSVSLRKGECDVNQSQSAKDYCYLYQSNSVRVTARDNRCDIYEEPKLAQLCTKAVNGEVTIDDFCQVIVDPQLQVQCYGYNLDAVRVNYYR
jgi:hypothetical protein